MRTCLASWAPCEPLLEKRPPSLHIAWLAVAAALSLTMTVGCSKQPDSSITPSDSQSHPDAAAATESEPRDALHGEGSVGGVPTRYSAYFEAAQLQRISETRNSHERGEYVFQGARLIEYPGNVPGSTVDIELHFDLQGVPAPPTAGNAPQLSDVQLHSISARAQMLRSLALARRSTQTHTGQH